jgi:hypothetical protein
VILDAMLVIEAHAIGIWDNLVDKIDAIIPSTVVKDEAFYFDSKKTGKRGPILISQAISSGKVAEIDAMGRLGRFQLPPSPQKSLIKLKIGCAWGFPSAGFRHRINGSTFL